MTIISNKKNIKQTQKLLPEIGKPKQKKGNHVYIFLKIKKKAASFTEYSILTSLIGVLTLFSVSKLGEETKTTFNLVSTTLSSQIESNNPLYSSEDSTENTQDNTSVQEPEPEAPAPPSGTYNFTAGKAFTPQIGYSRASYNPIYYGTLNSESGTSLNEIHASNGMFTLVLSGNHENRISNLTLFCNDGEISLNTNSVGQHRYLTDKDSTLTEWHSYSGPTFGQGRNYQCSLS